MFLLYLQSPNIDFIMKIFDFFSCAEALYALVIVCMYGQKTNVSHGAGNVLERLGAGVTADGVSADKREIPRMMLILVAVMLGWACSAFVMVVAVMKGIAELQRLFQ